MHAIIRLLTALYEKDTQELPFDFACLLQDTEKHLHLVYTWDRVEIDTAFICEKVAYSEDCVPLTSIRKTKLLYFSNTISLEDMEQYYGMRNNNLYTDPLYDCSLCASMIRAQEASNVTSDNRALESQLFTYFTFESYQEARYLFDRNQRNILLHMRNQGYPVPFPRELNLEIYSSLERLKKVNDAIGGRSQADDYSNWCQQYNNFSYLSQNRYFILTELSLNCMVNFLLEVNGLLQYSDMEQVILPEEFTNSWSYIKTMNSAFAPNLVSDNNSQLQDY